MVIRWSPSSAPAWGWPSGGSGLKAGLSAQEAESWAEGQFGGAPLGDAH